MRYTPIILAALLLAGCGGRTRLNPGAQYGFYIGSTQWMQEACARMYPGVNNNSPTRLLGLYEPLTGDITISEQVRGVGWLKVGCDELQHAYAHQQPPDLITLLRKYEGPTFRLVAHDEDEIAVLNAMCATLPPPEPSANDLP